MLNRTWLLIILLVCSDFFIGCEPLATDFEDTESAQYYQTQRTLSPIPTVDTIKIMTWNIRFGARRLGWFGESCGDRIILSREEVLLGLEGIANKIYTIRPDILLLQEVDVNSKRSAYIDQMQWLLNHTYFDYGVYASNWQGQFIPSDGLGRIDEGNAILSRWKLKNCKRIALSLRGDLDFATRYFYVRNNIVTVLVELPDSPEITVLCTHFEAFSTDDTKRKHVEKTLAELAKLDTKGEEFIIGGDFNLIPPGSDSTDFCDEDKCPGEHFHGKHDDPKHKEGSNYAPEIDWLMPFYERYKPAVPLNDYLSNQSHYFTHTTIHPDGFWNRKLDYLFTNEEFITGSDITHQEAMQESDHCPVTVLYLIRRK